MNRGYVILLEKGAILIVPTPFRPHQNQTGSCISIFIQEVSQIQSTLFIQDEPEPACDSASSSFSGVGSLSRGM